MIKKQYLKGRPVCKVTFSLPKTEADNAVVSWAISPTGKPGHADGTA